jgi:hypothetical protein
MTMNSLANSPISLDVWYGKNSSKMLNKDKTSNTKGRQSADIETPITIQKAELFTIPLKTLKTRN